MSSLTTALRIISRRATIKARRRRKIYGRRWCTIALYSKNCWTQRNLQKRRQAMKDEDQDRKRSVPDAGGEEKQVNKSPSTRVLPEHQEQTSSNKIGEERRSNKSISTREVAKDLERTPSSKGDDSATTALFPENESRDFHKRWTDIQTAFVDEPRRAVERADELVAEVIKRLADSFAQERSKLEGQWGRGDNVSTEDLRIALQRYRAFFDRLLNI